MYDTLVLLRALLLSGFLSSTTRMKRVVQDAVKIMFPGVLDVLTDRLLSGGSGLVPSKSTISRGLFGLDVALMLLVRWDTRASVWRFGWADSSPQAGFDFLLSAHDEIDEANAIPVLRAHRVVCRQRALQEADDEDFDKAALEDAMEVLYSGIARCNDIPVAVGKGATALQHKCAALLYKWWLLRGSQDGLLKHRMSYRCMCTDLGTEVGSAGFEIASPWSLLPAWLKPGDMDPDVHEANDIEAHPFMESDVMEEEVFDPPIAPDAWGDVKLFLPTAVTIPGTLHLISNLTREISAGLGHWAAWFKQLRQFEHLWKEGRKDRYLAYCLLPSDLAARSSDFDVELGSLYKQRWGEVIKFVRKLEPLLPVLRLTWDEGKYMHGGDGITVKPSAEFQPHHFTAVLSDNLFFGYTRMVLAVETITETLASWCESCQCHSEELLRERRTRKRPRVAPSSRQRPCPMKGKNLPALVCGQLSVAFEELSRMSTMKLQETARIYMSAEQWEICSRDLLAAKAGIRAAMEVKFDWVKRLPWSLACVASDDSSQARDGLRKAADLYDSQPGPVQQFHHGVTKRWLDHSGPLRHSVDAFIAGTALEGLPLLEHEAASFRLMNIAERYIEAGHAQIKRKKMGRNWKGRSAVRMSLAARLPEAVTRVNEDPAYIQALATAFAKARVRKIVPELLGLLRHPTVAVALANRPMRLDKVEKELRQVVYRTDSIGMMFDGKEAGRHDERAKDKEQRAADHATAVAEPVAPVTFDSVLRHALVDHFQVVADDNMLSYYTLPTDDTSAPRFDATADLMQGPAGLAPARDHTGKVDADVAMDDAAAISMDLMICRVVKARPCNWHVVPMARAAGRKLTSMDVAVTLHAGYLRGSELVVSSEPMSHHNPVTILRGFRGVDIGVVEQRFMSWNAGGHAMYQIPSFHSPVADQDSCSNVLTQMVHAGAFPCRDGIADQRHTFSVRLAADSSDSRAIAALERAGYVSCLHHEGEVQKFVLTNEAMSVLELRDHRSSCNSIADCGLK